jgi:hypothetical protein
MIANPVGSTGSIQNKLGSNNVNASCLRDTIKFHESSSSAVAHGMNQLCELPKFKKWWMRF